MSRRIFTMLSFSCATLVAALVLGSAAQAGSVVNSPVVGQVNGDGSGYFYGSLRDARDSASSLAFIGCRVNAWSTSGGSTSGSIYCSANNGYSGQGGCYLSASAPNFAATRDALALVSDSSRITFFFDKSGTCTSVGVENYSTFMR